MANPESGSVPKHRWREGAGDQEPVDVRLSEHQLGRRPVRLADQHRRSAERFSGLQRFRPAEHGEFLARQALLQSRYRPSPQPPEHPADAGRQLQLQRPEHGNSERSDQRHANRLRVRQLPARHRRQRLPIRPGRPRRPPRVSRTVLPGRLEGEFAPDIEPRTPLGIPAAVHGGGRPAVELESGREDPVSGRNGAYQFAGNCSGCTGRRYFGSRSLRDFGPRIGFAYRPGEKWTIRGSYGIMYEGDLFNGFSGTPLGKQSAFRLAAPGT